MKKTLFFYALLLLLVFQAEAQQKKKSILKVSYTSSPLSVRMLQMLKSQIKDPQAYQNMIEKINDAKIYYTLYYNINTQESVFTLDSSVDAQNIKTAGYTSFLYKDEKGDFLGKEKFINSLYYFKGNTSEVEWSITSETKKIGTYSCKKAVLKNSPDVSVWFTTDVPAQIGPNYFFGLPGLVVDSDSYFDTISLKSVSYLDTEREMANQIVSLKTEVAGKKAIAFKEALQSKQNFIKMGEAKMAKKVE